MKTIITSFFLFILLQSGYSQITLTAGQVYDYNVGDVFLKQETINNIPSLNPQNKKFIQSTVLNKTLSTALDTVFYRNYRYTMEVQYYYPGFSAPYTTTIFYSDTIDLSYTNLSLEVKDYCLTTSFFTEYPFLDPDPCLIDSVDTLYTIPGYFCGKNMWEKSFNIGATCFEPNDPTVRFFEGMGDQYSYFDYGAATENMTQLVYAIKGTDTCGTYVSIATSITNLEIEKPFTISPVPSNGISAIHFNNPIEYELEIYDVSGKRIQKVAKTINLEYRIDLTKEKAGIYFGKVITKGNSWNFRMIIE